MQPLQCVLVVCLVVVVKAALEQDFENYKKEASLKFYDIHHENEYKDSFIKTYNLTKHKDPARGSARNSTYGTGAVVPVRVHPTLRSLNGVGNPKKPIIANAYYPTEFQEPEGLNIPESLDWRQYGLVNNATNQGDCGVCYIFTGLAVMEAQYALKYGTLIKFSEQYLRDCLWDPKFTENRITTCPAPGAPPPTVYQFASVAPLLQRHEYEPYHDKDVLKRTCKLQLQKGIKMDVTQIGSVHGDEDQILRALVAVGPLAANINADQLDCPYPKPGKEVFTRNCSTVITHAVLIIGYGTDRYGTDFWIIRNSWGPTWNGDGTFKLQRGVNKCGIATDLSWPCSSNNCYPASPFNIG